MYTHSEDLFITAMFLKRYRGRTEEGLGSAIKFKELINIHNWKFHIITTYGIHLQIVYIC